MNQNQIKKFLDDHQAKKDRTVVVIDFGNVEKWKVNLGWNIGIREMATLVKCLSSGNKELRRFYYGSDYGEKESNRYMLPWSKGIIDSAEMNGFWIVTKRVKYIHTGISERPYEKKCDLDVEMAVDLIRDRDLYDTVILFSGDGDITYAARYLHEEYGKEVIVFGARNHIGREVFDGLADGTLANVMFAEDFEYRLKMKTRYR